MVYVVWGGGNRLQVYFEKGVFNNNYFIICLLLYVYCYWFKNYLMKILK